MLAIMAASEGSRSSRTSCVPTDSICSAVSVKKSLSISAIPPRRRKTREDGDYAREGLRSLEKRPLGERRLLLNGGLNRIGGNPHPFGRTGQRQLHSASPGDEPAIVGLDAMRIDRAAIRGACEQSRHVAGNARIGAVCLHADSGRLSLAGNGHAD